MKSFVAFVVFAAALALCQSGEAAVVRSTDTGFSLEQQVELAVDPGTAYDVMTGDISGWWDHSFSESPKELYIEAKPGGGFYEIFDDSGDGALHATVILAERGKTLRFTGPLGLSGTAVDMVVTYAYEPRLEGCVVKLTVDASGNVKEGLAEMVDHVWTHFLVERLKPYVESGKYLEKME